MLDVSLVDGSSVVLVVVSAVVDVSEVVVGLVVVVLDSVSSEAVVG